MRLLVVTQYFWPETFVINDLARTLAAQGHDVVVATGKPNYPGGDVYPGYTRRGIQVDRFGPSIEVLRVPMRPRGRGGAWNLFRNYLSFAWSGYRRFPRLLAGERFDAILAYCPSPITGAIPAAALKRSTGAHLAIWVQDLWPESLEATGFVTSPLALALTGQLVRRIYAAADTLLVQSRAFTAPVAKHAALDKIVYYPNSMLDAAPAGATLPKALAETLATKFCVVFAGNIGTAQSMETVVEAAARLTDLPDVRLVLVGSGSRSSWIEAQVRMRNLDNVLLVGRLPNELMGAIYERAEGLLVTLADHEIFSYTVPSKMQGYFAAGRPIIASLNGEGARVVGEASAGLSCAAEDAEGLARCVRTLRSMSTEERAQLGTNGRRYFEDNFEMSAQAARLVQILEQRISAQRGAEA